MAIISPFAAVRYDARQVGGLDKVLTQPYDKITPAMQKEYLERSPHNLAYILKGKAEEGDSPTDNVYTRASAYLRKWREQGVLLQRERPALYAYFQQFHLPGTPRQSPLVRKGFIGLGDLENYDSGWSFAMSRRTPGLSWTGWSCCERHGLTSVRSLCCTVIRKRRSTAAG